MKPVTLGPLGIGSVEQRLKSIEAALQVIASATQEEPIRVFDSYSSDSAATVTRQVLIGAPTTANVAAVLATLIADMQKRGVNRTQPT